MMTVLDVEPESDIDLTELIEGEEIVGPSPFNRHQSVVANLYDELRRYVKENDLGIVPFTPLDVILEEGVNRLQPDVMFIKKENLAIVQDWIRGVPDMVAEVVSKSSVVRDTITKKAIYQRYRVPEYWIVMPEYEAIEVFAIEQGVYELFSCAVESGYVKSKIIHGLEIDAAGIFVN
ncbi:MAG: Uma2 family endonuclease [Candidatus Magnetobacterium sp. LHC-1]|uniref:Uma2 family endonuclease n=1 Tax=Candidatus Magnetobacterium casense TaxID=1455061 RepID=A0ABS6RW12_9BACT|nr:Uma2 family endonuclease [Candidatus Magnetobacterium casensis]MBF0607677.1 Uma2 family endonuclease [Nitrospirota bacterium]MBV6340819.1 Uma2 family endonuclease [Candidatus Magnetobacterium casensis]